MAGIALVASIFTFLVVLGNLAETQKLRREVNMLIECEKNRTRIIADAVNKLLRERRGVH